MQCPKDGCLEVLQRGCASGEAAAGRKTSEDACVRMRDFGEAVCQWEGLGKEEQVRAMKWLGSREQLLGTINWYAFDRDLASILAVRWPRARNEKQRKA